VGQLPQLDTETVPDAATADGPASATASPSGTALGRYVVLGEIGRGGMGRVLRAYDPKLQREVALKLLRTRSITGDARERMVREARAMAKLSHPNVVALHDVAESSQGLMLVMEHVAGRTLREWIAEQPRTWQASIEVFAAAGRGLAAAHAQGLLHRDFKPSNVLIGTGPASVVKVTDFGLAKAAPSEPVDLDAAAPDNVVIAIDEPWGGITESGKVMGTPRYMAPEQHRGLRLGPASDQYSFCLALWEALTGRFPFDDAALVEDKHAGPPPWPPAIAVPRRIVDALRRGLAVDPAVRWPGIAELLAALDYDPARRRRRAWVTGGALVGAGSLAIALQSWANARAERCSGAPAQLVGVWDDPRREQIATSFAATEAVFADAMWSYVQPRLDDYAAAWVQMHGEACAATTIRGEQSSEVMDLRMSCLQRARVELQAVTDVLIVADREVVSRAHLLVANLAPLPRCADVEALQAEVDPPAPDQRPAVEHARATLAVAAAERGAGRYADARASLDAAQSQLGALDYPPLHTELALERGRLLADAGDYAGAEQSLHDAVRTAAQSRQWDRLGEAASLLLYVVGNLLEHPAEGLRYRDLAEGLARRGGDPITLAAFHNSLGSVLEAQGKPAEAEQSFRIALALRTKALGEADTEVARARNNLANALMSQGRYPEAELESRAALAMQERLLGPQHPVVALGRNNLATILEVQGRGADAQTEYRAALEIWERALGEHHPDLALAHNNLANLLAARSDHDGAELEYRRAIAIASAALGAEHPDVARYRNNLGTVFFARGEIDRAQAEHRAALAIWERALGPEHPSVATALAAIGNTSMGRGDYRQGELEHRRALAIWEQAYGPEHPSVTMSHNNLAIIATANGEFASAEAEHRLALAVRLRMLGEQHPDVAMSRSSLAAVLIELGRPDEAVLLAEQAWKIRDREGIAAEQRAETAYFLARALWASNGDRVRARELAERSAALYDTAGAGWTAQRDEVRAWARDPQ
jgi:eukaryotic-like serine/threonine-protein kinase